jgi:superfamily II DNA or RNA helicase
MIEIDVDIKSTKVHLRFSCNDTFKRLREHFSVTNKAATFARRKGRFMPSRKYVITPAGKCDFGLLQEIKKWLIENQFICKFNLSEGYKQFIQRSKKHDHLLHNDDEFYNRFNVELRYYQKEVLNKAFENGYGTCVLSTGAGKTILTAALIERFYQKSNNKNFKCLVIVPDTGLVQQTYDEFLGCGITFSISKWSGSSKIDKTTNTIICNSQILYSQFDNNKWLSEVDLLIVDECHKIKSSTEISNIISTFTTPNRFGFTGTLPEDNIDRWSVIGKLGGVIYEKNSYELRQEEYLVNAQVKILQIHYTDNIPRISNNKYRNELEYLYKNAKRNKLLSDISKKLNNNCLILVNHIEHGESVFDFISKLNPDKRVYFIQGSTPVEERERIKRDMEEFKNVICIAMSSIFSTGVNIKNLHYIIFAAGGKSFIRTVQSIGRGLRKHLSKTQLVIFDIGDQLHYGQKHLESRKKIYEQQKIQFTSVDLFAS